MRRSDGFVRDMENLNDYNGASRSGGAALP